MSEYNNINIYFLGDHSVGKSSIILEYLVKSHLNVEPTKSMDKYKKEIEKKINDSKIKIVLNIWDIRGDLNYADSIKFLKNKNNIFILVYDVTNKDSFTNLNKWEELIPDFEENTIIAIIGNKNDLKEKRVVLGEEGIKYAEAINALFFLISVNDKERINEVFSIIIDKFYQEFPEHIIDSEEKYEIHSPIILKPKKKTKKKSNCVGETVRAVGNFFCGMLKAGAYAMEEMIERKILYKYNKINKEIEKSEEKKDNKIEGNKRQIIKYTNGEVYEGECNNNVRDGFGTMKYNIGIKYIGEWKNDHIEGKGTLEYKNGEIYEGEWEKGILINGSVKSKNNDNTIIVVENEKFQKEKIKILFIGNNLVDKISINGIDNNDINEEKEEEKKEEEEKEEEEEIEFSFNDDEKLIEISSENLEMKKVKENEINDNIIENVKIIILVYDISDKNTFQNLKLSYEKIQKISNLRQIKYGIIGNKTNLKNKKEDVSFIDVKLFSKSIKASFIQTNIKNEDKILKFLQKILTDYYMSKDTGILVDGDCCFYGELNKMKKEGYGIMINKSESYTYSGNWKNDLKNGYGILRTGEQFYEGEWENDKPIKGKLYYSNIYLEGYYSDGELINGYMEHPNISLIISKDNEDIFRMKNGNLIEKKESYSDSSTIKYKNGKVFMGKIDGNFKRDGEGILIFDNKDIFIGEWEKDILSSNKGIIIYNNGDFYQGEFNIDIYNNKEKAEYSLTEEDIEKYNFNEKIKYIEDNFPEDLDNLNFFSKYDNEILENELEENDIYEIWNLGMENKDNYLEKKEEIESIKEQYKELSFFSTKDEKLILIKKIENLFDFTNKLRKFIIFKNVISFDNIRNENIENLEKNFRIFDEISFFEGRINYDGIDFKCKEGKGIMKYKNGDIYEGEWKNDLREGKGIMKYKIGDIYEGEWKNDLREGRGIMKFRTGDNYEGEWANDLREGQGIMKYINGEEYEGEWKKDLRDGKGIFKYKNNDIKEGIWKEDKYIEENICEEKLDFNSKYCQIKGHEKNLIVVYCIDDNCPYSNKLLCIDCICSIHNQHKIIKIEQFNKTIMNNFNSKIDQKYVSTDNIKAKFKELRESVETLLNEKEKLFIEYNEKFLKEESKRKLNKYIKLIKQNINDKKCIEEAGKNFSNLYDFENMRKTILDSIINTFSLSSHFIIIDNPWMDEIIDSKNKQFGYKLEENNYLAKKINGNSDSIISKLKFKNGGVYKIEFILNYTKKKNNINIIIEEEDENNNEILLENDDEQNYNYEVGFGNVELIKSNDIIDKKGISFSYNGLIINGKKYGNSYLKKNIRNICFILYLNNKMKNFTLFTDDEFICNESFDGDNFFALARIKGKENNIYLKTMIKS